MAGVDADPERHDAAVLGEVHPVDHERHQVQGGQVRGKQLGQCMLGHRHELARDRRLAGRARGRGDLLTYTDAATPNRTPRGSAVTDARIT